MVDDLIKSSKHKKSGFYLNDYERLSETILKLEEEIANLKDDKDLLERKSKVPPLAHSDPLVLSHRRLSVFKKQQVSKIVPTEPTR